MGILIFLVERGRLEKVKNLKEEILEAKHQLEVAQRQGNLELAGRLRFSTIPELQKQLPAEGESGGLVEEDPERDTNMMLHERVTSDDIARVVAKATGIPVQNLLKGDRDKLVHVGILTCCSSRYSPRYADGGISSATRSGTGPRRRSHQ